MNIFIGISPRIIIKNIENKNRLFINLNNDYLDKLINLNLIPFILPLKNINNYLSLCSGFIITGGDDINPSKYNEPIINSNYDDTIDDIDFLIIDYAYKNKIPLLGICRGIQIINVYFQGSLIQHYDNHFTKHIVTYKNRSFFVNSSHHQIINILGNDLIPIFQNNKVIEAVIHKDLFIFGVQWHPERMDDLTSNFIFKYFKKEVIKYAQTNQRNKDL